MRCPNGSQKPEDPLLGKGSSFVAGQNFEPATFGLKSDAPRLQERRIQRSAARPIPFQPSAGGLLAVASLNLDWTGSDLWRNLWSLDRPRYLLRGRCHDLHPRDT